MHTYYRQYRFVGLLLLVSFLLFWGGTVFSINLVDTKGTSIFLLPPQQVLPVIAAHTPPWQWQSLLQLGSSVVAAVGLLLLIATGFPLRGAPSEK